MGKFFTKIKYRPLTIAVAAIGIVSAYIATSPQVYAALPAPGGIDSGLALWLKADSASLVVNGSNQVEQWNDDSGSGLVVNEARAASTDIGVISPSNSILKVANGINFNPAVDFAGTSNIALRGSASVSWSSTADLNIFAVNLAEGQSPGSLSGLLTTNGSWTSGANVGRGLLANKAGDSYMLDGAGCSPGSTPASARTHIARGIYTSTTTTLGGSTWLDGKKEFDTGACGQGSGGVNFEIGGRTGDTGFENRIFNGKIPEIIVYKSALTTTQAQQIDSYLAIKYGVTLNSTSLDYLASDGTTKAWDAVANAGYYNNVFGIGRDDNSTLYQKQSKSLNPGAIVTIGNGNTIEADNATNATTFTNNLTFMMVGDNGAQTSPSGLLAGTTTNQVRMGRAWKVDETSTVGSVKVSVPATSVPGTSPILVRSADATFTTGDTIIPLSSDGSGNFQADYDFSDGDYFTFAYVGAAPGGVFDLTAWQKANDGTVSPSNWSDASGNNNAAVMTVVGNQPAVVANGVNFNPAVDFNGPADYYQYSSALGIAGTGNFSHVTVGMFRNFTGSPVFSGSAPATNQLHFQYSTTGNLWAGTGGGGGGCSITNSSTGLQTNLPGIASGIRNSSVMTVRLNANVTTQGSGSCPSDFSASAHRTLGGRPGTGYMNGLVPESIHYSHALSDAELQRVDSYLAVKYGITLPTVDYADSAGGTIWSRATNSSYNNNITGIGRDDLSALNQKQSRSTNPQGIVTVGNGTIAADNISNPNNFADDKDFLMFGDDNNPANTWVDTGVTTTPLTNFKRIPRTWKTQDTGSVGNVTLALDTADPDADVPNAISGYYLLRDSNNNGSFADETPIAMSDAGGGQFSVSGVNLANGELFTFATLSNVYNVQIQVADNITNESGKTGLFKVRLGARPSAPVTITLSSSNTNEGTVQPNITIQPDDWDDFEANQVIVTGVNDGIPTNDGSTQYFINTDDVTSADPNFNALTGTDVDNVLMYNLDNDAPGISAYSFGGNVTTESGGCATVRFELLSMPSAPVTVPLSLSDATEGTLNGVVQITIQPANWNQPQSNVVTVCGLADGIVDGDALYYLVTGDPTSADSSYNAITADQVADVALVNMNVDTDSDGDGVDDAVEDAAPNSGDANEDGIQDSIQKSVASFVSDVTGNYATLQIDDVCQINTERVTAEAAQAVADPGFDYPHGLMNFQADCGTPGFEATVQQYYYGVTEANLVARKYNPATNVYFSIDGATVEQPTIGGEALTKATFQITDGGQLDTDGNSNGVIVDPAGLGVLIPVAPGNPGTSDPLANTGTSIPATITLALGIMGVGVSTIIWNMRLKRA